MTGAARTLIDAYRRQNRSALIDSRPASPPATSTRLKPSRSSGSPRLRDDIAACYRRPSLDFSRLLRRIDPDTSTITNTSVWNTRHEAMAMSSVQEMRDLKGSFERLGVDFDPIANYDILWDT